jgi:hypothetical protein
VLVEKRKKNIAFLAFEKRVVTQHMTNIYAIEQILCCTMFGEQNVILVF